MKVGAALLAIGVLLAAIVPSSAKDIAARPFFLERPVTINGADIAPGMYSLALEPHGSAVRVTLSRDGRFIVTAQGTWVKSGVKYKENAVLLRVNSDGSRSLIEIRLAGTGKTIVLDSASPVLRVGTAQR